VLTVEMIARIRHECFLKSKSIKKIVRQLKVSGGTVQKALRSGAAAFSSSVRCSRCRSWPLEGSSRPAACGKRRVLRSLKLRALTRCLSLRATP